jgi:hypothetical protein
LYQFGCNGKLSVECASGGDGLWKAPSKSFVLTWTYDGVQTFIGITWKRHSIFVYHVCRNMDLRGRISASLCQGAPRVVSMLILGIAIAFYTRLYLNLIELLFSHESDHISFQHPLSSRCQDSFEQASEFLLQKHHVCALLA